jgi:hypothetical protein
MFDEWWPWCRRSQGTPVMRAFAGLLLLLIASGAVAQTTPTPPPQGEKSDLDKVGDTMSGVAEKPLKDLNIIKPEVDPYLEPLMKNPYALKGLRTCKDYKAAIARLDSILGPDVDSAAAQNQTKQSPAEFALETGASVAGSLIPLSGLIRKISGADARQKYANAAVYAGGLRRAYVKGLAKGRGCRL